MKQRIALVLSLACPLAGSLLQFSPVTAQVTPDGTTNTAVNAEGNKFTIEDGDRAGSNLFHSFRDFSVPNGGSAFFDNADVIENIFSRVTGGNLSNIDGLIRANDANLFLINPAGIIFGAGARLDLGGGSFYGSSANSILFPDDIEFSASDTQAQPILTINAPIGLGFRDEPGDIVNNSVANDGRGLEVGTGNNITLLGGNISFDGGNIFAPGGLVNLGGLTASGTIGIAENGTLTFPENVARGDISLINDADIDVRSDGGGSISVNAKDLELTNGSSLDTSTIGIGNAGNIDLEIGGLIELIDGEISSEVDSGATGDAGDILITAGSLELNETAQIDNSTSGDGNSGNITINAAKNITFNDSNIFSQVGDTGEGNGGNITFNTTNLSLFDSSQISARVFGKGDAGKVTVNATGDVTFEGVDSEGVPSGIISELFTEAQGSAGDITITTGNLNLTNGGRVSANTFSQGNAGLVNITASDTITIDGEASDGFPSIASSGVSSLEAVGNAGGVTITTRNLNLTNGGVVDANTGGQGNAGSVKITATDTITIDGETSDGFASRVTSDVASKAEGDAGGVTISTGNLNLTNGGEVSASTRGQGNAGSVNITARDTITIDGETLGGFPKLIHI